MRYELTAALHRGARCAPVLAVAINHSSAASARIKARNAFDRPRFSSGRRRTAGRRDCARCLGVRVKGLLREVA